MTDNKSDVNQTGSRQAHKTKFEGMLIFDLNIFEDPRGKFTEVWQTEAMQPLGLPTVEPKQLGIAHSKKGTIRAIHAEPYDKIVHVVRGKVFCAMVDLRPDSETFGQVDTFELDSKQMLFIPKGVGNGVQAISDEEVDYVYCVTGVWSAEKAYSGQYLAINYADADLNIKWPIGSDGWIVSLKDQQNPTMRQSFPEKFSGR
jgi:dTDP-4-dehydrorhamnose 3,5-epimerase